MINKLVLVCSRPDIETFRYNVQYINKYISYESCVLCVPERDISLFSDCMPLRCTLVTDEDFAEIISMSEVKAYMAPELKHRAGWYLQQFLKIILVSQGDKNDINLIWDCDTIPLKSSKFIDADGTVIFNYGFERHKPYFDTIEKVLGIQRASARSFICQHMPVKVNWMMSLHNDNLKDFFVRVLSALKNVDQSEFSEYETIGTYVMHNFNGEVKMRFSPWLRDGGRFVSFNPSSALFRVLTYIYSFFFYYVAYEKYNNK